MKTTWLPALSTLWRSPKKQFLTLILLLGAWPGASTAQAATAGTVGIWGYPDPVPVEAQSGVTAIAAGSGFTVALKTNGSVLAWGYNNYGQTTVPAGAQSGVQAIAAGPSHAVALKTDGSVVSWGSLDQSTVPVAALSGVTAAAAGGYELGGYTLVLKNDGSVLAWGRNDYGQTNVPAGLSGVMAIAAGGYNAAALQSNGAVVVWGHSGAGQTTIPVAAQSGVIAIAVGGYHILALKNDGSVVAWGYNFAGGTTVPVAAQSGVVAVSAAGFHSIALKNDGTVVTWGDNGRYEAPAGLVGVTAIAAGAGHTVVIVIPTPPTITAQPVSQTVGVWQSTSFSVAAAGYPLTYQWRKNGVNVGGATSPGLTLSLPQIDQAGAYTVVVTNRAGSVTSAPAVLTVTAASPITVIAWGDNTYGQTMVPVAAQNGVSAIAAGSGHTLALKTNGAVLAWGRNYEGQSTVPAAAQSGVTAIAAGNSHSLALKNGAVVAWGANSAGQTAVPVAAQSGVTAIAAGEGNTVALKNDGTVVAWGDYGYAATNVPPGLSGVTAIAAGRFHIVALKGDGSVVVWEGNAGQTNVPVAAQSGVIAISAGNSHTAALKNDGSVVAWGGNYGSNQTIVAGGATAIAAGYDYIAVLRSDGTVVGTPTVPASLGGVTAIAAGYYHFVAVFSPTRVQLAAADYSVMENTGALSIVVQRIGDLSGTHTVDFATQDGGAIAGSDYTALSGTLVFTPGQSTQAVSILILNDGAAESTETFQLRLSNLTGGAALLGAPATSIITIQDNDPGFQFSAAHYSVSETSGVATITVLRGDDLSSAVTVDYATSDGTATAGADYTARSGTLHFAAGETNQTLLIPLLDDDLNEGSEDFHLTLANASAGVSIGASRESVVVILDDERPSRTRSRGQLKTIAAGAVHNLALKSDGSLWAWGSDWWGQLGDGASQTNRTTPVRIGTDTDWRAVEAGGSHSVALKTDGSLWAWGHNLSGQLGDGTTTDRDRPVRIGADKDWSVIAAGQVLGEEAFQERTLALKQDGSLWAWGDGWSLTGPLRIGTDTDWTTISVALYGLALKADGSLWQLPVSVEAAAVPLQVGIENGWFTVTAGGEEGWFSRGDYNLGLKADGTLTAWGDNTYGQLGNGTNDSGTNTPVSIGSDKDWAVIAAGSRHSAALKQEGSLWVWGANWSGQLGNGTLSDTNRPVRAGLDYDWVALEAGYSHTLALKEDGSLWAWGDNSSGQLGLGLTLDLRLSTNVPLRIGTDYDWALPPLPASEFRITSQEIDGEGKLRLSFSHTNAFSYFVLYRGTDVTHINQSVDATLGPFVFQLSDPTPVSSDASAFYRIRAVPLAQPLDLDGDGIDDAYELRHRTFLNPLNPADAALDFDGDGRSNLEEYRDGTDPATAP